ncbi:MAG: hypothetical protein KC713_10155 [Candidatus Omnitrophica bacterium]|nr:hypothetical protein [Candidatus Omnitrophota bacterium]
MDELTHNFTHVFSVVFSDWGSTHPLVIHFPIALYFVAPIFILAGLIFKKRSKTFYTSALILMVLGLAAVFTALSSGESAAEHLKPDSTVVETLGEHDELAHRTRNIFVILTVTFFIFVLLQNKFDKKAHRQPQAIFLILFLLAYLFGLLTLLNTAHYGGKLVHYHGIHSQFFK